MSAQVQPVAQVPLNIATRGLVPGLEADWLAAPRAELEETRLQALEVVGGAGLAMGGGQLASVERAGRALIDADAYRESGWDPEALVKFWQVA